METETMTDAQRVAADHADTLAAFGEWLDTFGDGAPRWQIDDTANDDDADVDDDKREMARAALEWLDDTGAEDLSWGSFVNDVLDIEISGRFDSESGEWHVTDVAALITCGGPNVRYHVHGNGTIRVSVAWWNDHADRVVDSGLADYLTEYADGVAS